jgi:hypothetical protein
MINVGISLSVEVYKVECFLSLLLNLYGDTMSCQADTLENCILRCQQNNRTTTHKRISELDENLLMYCMCQCAYDAVDCSKLTTT